MRPSILAAILLVCVVGVSCDAATEAAPLSPHASSAFWSHWGDGRAELSGYAVSVSRYGELREGQVVLIYVTEPMDSRSWIKDDRGDVPQKYRVNVLKLNHTLSFRTGIYPYSVMTSVFAPVDGLFPERFAPSKLTLSAQEWCGHAFHTVKPTASRFESEVRSYFSAEGERQRSVPTRAGTLYADALLVQLRELDGSFNDGKDWQGQLVPTLWSARKTHRPLQPVPATIRRSAAERDGVPVTRFVIAYGDITRTIDVERKAPRRILGWSASDGEEARLLRTVRLPYWQLNRPGDESYLEQIGIPSEAP